MRLALAVLAAFSIAAPATAQDQGLRDAYRQLIAPFCKQRWPEDFVMREHCQKLQDLAMRKWTAAMPKLRDGSDVHGIMMMCKSRWTERDLRIDWVMVVHCTERQIDAYERLNKAKP